jgi:hypothetical protein
MSSSKINYLHKGLCDWGLSEFIDCRYSWSCWYFRPSFVNCCPSILLWFTLPPPFPPSLCDDRLKTCRKVPLLVKLLRGRRRWSKKRKLLACPVSRLPHSRAPSLFNIYTLQYCSQPSEKSYSFPYIGSML